MIERRGPGVDKPHTERVTVPSTGFSFGAQGTPHRDSWPAREGLPPGEKSVRSVSHSQQR